LLKTIFLALLLFNFYQLNLHALDISIQGAKQDHKAYSTLHLKDNNSFLCQENKNDFDQVVKIICAFSKSPSKDIQKIKNDFFNIETEIKDKTFFLIITPNHKIKLYPIIFDLTKDDTVFQADVEFSKHWMIIGYIDTIPFIKQNTYSDTSINFPFMHEADKLPFVGGLDINGNPVYIKKIGDVTSYIKIKGLYEKGKYEFCLELIDEVMTKYPNTLFLAELIYYKLKVYAQLKNYDEVIDTSKIYLKDYSSDENVAEVLSLASTSYAKIGLNTDAIYFFDRLFSEHPDSVFTKWGYIYKGDMLESSGGVSKAVILYKKALNSTKDIDVATSAAYKLAHLYLANSNAKESAKFIQKIAKAKPEYFVSKFKRSLSMMYDYIDIEDYKSGATIAKCLLDNIKTTNDEHEVLMKNVGVWLSNTDDKKSALDALNLYLKEYSDGLYEQEVQIAKDSLFFQNNDENLTTKLNNYTKLMDTYTEDSIGYKATYEKAKLLLKNDKFNKVLDLETQLLVLDNQLYKDVNDIINDAAVGAMELALKNKECADVLKISAKYKISLSNDWDDGIYECSMMGGDHTLAKSIANKNLKSKDLSLRKKWLFRYIEVDFATGNYSELIPASKELILLIKNDKNTSYKKVYRILFDTYSRLGDNSGMMSSIEDIKKIYGIDYKDIDRYVAMIVAGDKLKDDNLIIKYASNVMKIQKMSNSFAQSPFVEFALYQAYMNKENYNDALLVMESLNNVKLNNSNRARQQYLLGSTYSKLWREDDAALAYQKAIDADKDSPWAELAKGAKGI